MNPFTPPPFTILVPQFASCGDPSMGRNPVITSTAMRLQHVVGADGTPRQSGPVAAIPAASAGDHQAAIEVAAPDYWDPATTPPGPFLLAEEIRVGDQYFLAGEDFGVGLGGGAGTVDQVAASLGATLAAAVPGISVAVDGDTVYITSLRPASQLPLAISNDMAVALASVSFILRDRAGTNLASGTAYRRTHLLPKFRRTQGPPQLV